MRNLKLLLLVAVFSIACNKSNVKTDSSTTLKIVKGNDTSPYYAGGCPTCASPTQPTSYTGLPDASIASLTGYGLYSDVNYDKGYFSGYNDGLAYFNTYFKAYGCTGKMELEVRPEGGTSGITLINPLTTPIPPNDAILASETVYTCKVAGATITTVMCETANDCGSYSLKLQYQFNTTYPGRTPTQSSFDSGRLQGFINATTRLPFAAN